MKYIYVLTSSEKDIYYEQFFLSAASMRLTNPDAEVIVIVDEKTKQGLTGKRSNYEKLISDIKIIKVPDEFSQKEASRWLKTSIHHYITGDFLFIDCDTVITGNLKYDFSEEIKAGGVLDTHTTLEKHHLREYFQQEDINAGFSSSLETNIRINGGLIFCKDDPKALQFFEKWHSLWLEGRKRGCSQDMPSLNQANFESDGIISELNGEWNCQISHNGLPYLQKAKIIHYFATSLVSFAHPYKLASAQVLTSIKETGELSENILELLKNPLSAFEENARIISDKQALEVMDSSLFYKLLWLKNRHSRFFERLNSLSIRLTSLLKKKTKNNKKILKGNQ